MSFKTGKFVKKKITCLRLRTEVGLRNFRTNSSWFPYFKKARKTPMDPGRSTKISQDACAPLVHADTGKSYI